MQKNEFCGLLKSFDMAKLSEINLFLSFKTTLTIFNDQNHFVNANWFHVFMSHAFVYRQEDHDDK
jgi:hypothetical protein